MPTSKKISKAIILVNQKRSVSSSIFSLSASNTENTIIATNTTMEITDNASIL